MLHVSDESDGLIWFFSGIGDVRNTSEFRDAIGTHMEITFSTRDAAKKALCMSGYTLGGCSLVVTPVENVEDCTPKRPDERRNLYVLGIPFDLTKAEFTAVFSRYGSVMHCVVLATVDNASRRRGFVVMSTHEEAKRAMMSLTRTQIKGHTIDISWSIVQRSQGFLDGGDRTNLFEPTNAPETTQNESPSTTTISSDDKDRVQTETSFTLVFKPSTTLLVTNLPFILFSQTSDLEPLLHPFGDIKKLEMITLPSPQETTSALVEYVDIVSATEAKESLQGQCYANYRINAEYACLAASMPSPTPSAPEFNDYDGKYPSYNDRNGYNIKSSSIFQGPVRPHSAFAGPTPLAKRPLQDISNSNYLPPHAPHYATHNVFPLKPSITRSSSVNSKWSVDSSHCSSRGQNDFAAYQLHHHPANMYKSRSIYD
uniref:RRM domain-containing protein n=1 Tax=Moniliophthora roreri TaxID=221103 RepID=A0A0W0FWD7_MONRR